MGNILDDEMMKRAIQNMHLFPYHLFGRNTKVLLYGAGNIGRQFYWQAMRDKYVIISGIVDKNYENVHIPDVEVKSPKSIHEISYDALLITMNRQDVAMEAYKELLEMGVRKDKLYWDGESYYRDHFYWHMYFPMLEKIGARGQFHQLIDGIGKSNACVESEMVCDKYSKYNLGEPYFIADFCKRVELKREYNNGLLEDFE